MEVFIITVSPSGAVRPRQTTHGLIFTTPLEWHYFILSDCKDSLMEQRSPFISHGAQYGNSQGRVVRGLLDEEMFWSPLESCRSLWSGSSRHPPKISSLPCSVYIPALCWLSHDSFALEQVSASLIILSWRRYMYPDPRNLRITHCSFWCTRCANFPESYFCSCCLCSCVMHVLGFCDRDPAETSFWFQYMKAR